MKKSRVLLAASLEVKMNREDFKKKYSAKRYLGDGLYAEFDGFQFILSADRFGTEHWIALEPDVFDNLIELRKEVYKEAELIEDKQKV
jgi:hypothetical protein